MTTKRSAPPVFGLFLLAAVVGAVAFAAVGVPDPFDGPSTAQLAAVATNTRQELPLGAEASRTAEFVRRDVLRNA